MIKVSLDLSMILSNCCFYTHQASVNYSFERTCLIQEGDIFIYTFQVFLCYVKKLLMSIVGVKMASILCNLTSRDYPVTFQYWNALGCCIIQNEKRAET